MKKVILKYVASKEQVKLIEELKEVGQINALDKALSFRSIPADCVLIERDEDVDKNKIYACDTSFGMSKLCRAYDEKRSKPIENIWLFSCLDETSGISVSPHHSIYDELLEMQNSSILHGDILEFENYREFLDWQIQKI